jgi:hypothetical protein
MPERGFWRAIWEEDLRAPSRDLVNQIFYLAVTVLLDGFSHLLLDRSMLPSWVRDLIYQVFDMLTVIALIQLAIPMGVRMLRSGYRSLWKK